MPAPLPTFTFFALLGSSLFLNIIYRSWKGRPILPNQWGLLAANGAILALSCLLRFQGLRSCGPLETIFADFTGALAAKVVLDSTKRTSGTLRKARGVFALLLGTFLLSQGWARASCSPLAIDVSYRTRSMVINEPNNCIKVWSIFAPALAGFLSVFQRSMGASGFLRSIGKKRVYVLSHALAALILLPIAILQLASMAGQTQWQLIRSTWPLSSTVALGLVVAFFGDFYAEEKLLMPSHSFKTFQIVTCCVCGLELLYGLDISLVGFIFCSFVLGLGVQELAFLPGQVTWEALGDTEYNSSVYASWIKGPLQHVMSDSKSRKIAIFLLINTGFMGIEFFYGFLSNSLGLISDACHMLFDCAALAIGLYASYISRLPENSKFNYGYGRFEVVSGYANAVLLVLVASLIVLESLERILEPPEISTKSLLLVSVGGLLVNLVGLVFFHEEHHHAHGGGGSCSHSHVEDHKVPHAGLHGTSSKVDHSIVTCVDTLLASQPNSHEHCDMHQGKVSTKFDTADGYKALCGDHNIDAKKADCIDFVECSKCYDQGHASHSFAKQSTSANSPVCQEHHLHECNVNGVHHSHSHEQIAFSSVASKHNHHECHDNGISHQKHDHHLHFIYQDHGHQHHHDQHAISHDHNHADEDAHKHEHNYAKGYDHDPDHCHGHDGHHQHHNHGHENHLHDNQEHSHSHDHHHHDHCHDSHHQHEGHDHENHLHPNQEKNHGHDHHHHHHHMDHNMYGIFLHVLADTLGSVGVVISTILIKYKGWLITDPACSIFLSALIIASVVPLLRNSAEILLQRTPRYNEDNLKAALKDISRIRGVKNSQRLHVWSFTSTTIIGSLHLQISAGSDKALIRKNVSQLLRDAGIVDLTLQIEEI